MVFATVFFMNTEHHPFICRIGTLFHSMAFLFIEFHQCCINLVYLFLTLVTSLFSIAILVNTSYVPNKETGGMISESKLCRSCMTMSSMDDGTNNTNDRQDGLTGDDIDIVFEKLGLPSAGDEDESWCNGKCRDCLLMDAASLLLEEKEASLEELEGAFAVFDRNGDGFVTPMDLRRVMRSLGLKEGFGLEDCRRMVEAFDEDGDGRISFLEFRSLFLNAV